MTKGSPHWSLWWPEQYAHSQMSESYNSICIKYFRQYSMTTDFKQSDRLVMLKLLFSWTTNACIWQIKVTLLTQTVPLCKMFRPTNSATHIFSTASCSSFQCFYIKNFFLPESVVNLSENCPCNIYIVLLCGIFFLLLFSSRNKQNVNL